MLRIFVVCNINRQMLPKKFLSNAIHLNLAKAIVLLSIMTRTFKVL